MSWLHVWLYQIGIIFQHINLNVDIIWGFSSAPTSCDQGPTISVFWMCIFLFRRFSSCFFPLRDLKDQLVPRNLHELKWLFQLDDEPNLSLRNGWKSPFPSIKKWLALGFPGIAQAALWARRPVLMGRKEVPPFQGFYPWWWGVFMGGEGGTLRSK